MTISASSSAMVWAAVASSTSVLFEVLLLLGVEVVVVLGHVGQRLGQSTGWPRTPSFSSRRRLSSRSLRRLSDW